MESHLYFSDHDKIEDLSFVVDRVEEIPVPKTGWYIQFFSNGMTKQVRVAGVNEAYSLYHFLVRVYSPGIFNYSKYYDEDKVKFLIEHVGREPNDSPYSVSSVSIYHLFNDSGNYRKMYYREV